MSSAHRSPTLKDIAARVGISESAASLALSGKPGVSDQTRQNVLAVAEEMGWTPNHAARVLSGGRSETIGLVFSRSAEDVGSETFFLQFLTGLQEALSTRGYGLLSQTANSPEEEIAIYRKWKRANRVDGVVLLDLKTDDPRPQTLFDIGLPALIAGGTDPRGLLPEIAARDSEAMQGIIEFLQDKGHQNIAYVCGDTKLAHIDKRAQKFQEHCKVPAAIFPTDFSAEQGAASTEAALQTEPTAIIYDNEVLAMSGMATLHNQQKRVPEDVSIVVWEEPAMADLMMPPLTTLSRKAFELGRTSGEALLEFIDTKTTKRVWLPAPKVVDRESVKNLA